MTETTDKGVGLAVLFGLLALAAAAYTAVAPTQELTAWGFALAVTLGVVLVVLIHAYGAPTNNH